MPSKMLLYLLLIISNFAQNYFDEIDENENEL